jgi:hypothetical protein
LAIRGGPSAVRVAKEIERSSHSVMGQNRDIDTKLRYFSVNSISTRVRFFHCVRGAGTPKLTVKTTEFVLILKCVPACKIRTAAKLRACLRVCRPRGAAARPRYGRRPPINMATMCLWFPCIFFKYHVRPEFSTTSRCPPARLLRRRCSPRPSRSALRCAHPPPHAEEMRAEFAPIGGLTCAAGG